MSLKKIIFFAVLVLVIVIACIFVIFNFSLLKNKFTGMYIERTLGVAMTYAEIFNGDSVELDLKRRKKNAHYDIWKTTGDSVLKKNELKYLYVMNIHHNDSIEYYINAENYIEHFGFLDKDDVYEFNPDDIKKLKTGAEIKISSISNTPKYGFIISSYVPIKNSKGKVVAFVGADKEIAKMNHELRKVAVSSLIIAILFIITVFFAIMFLVRKIFIFPLTKVIEAADNFNLLNISFEKMDFINIKEYDSLINSFKKMENKINSALKKSFTDDLTKLSNRYFFRLSMDNFLKPAVQERKIAFIIIDLDYFKQINDAYGHDKGDFALRGAGIVLHDVFGELPGVVARLGGDEFAICLENVDKQIIESKCEILKERLLKVKYSEEKNGLSASVGIAIASFSAKAPIYSDIFSVADAALYKVKAKGRNGYEIVEI